MPSLAVDQHKGLIGAEAPQLCGPNNVREVRVRLSWQIEGWHYRLQGRANLARQRGGLMDVGTRDDIDRGQAFVSDVTGKARADNDDFFQRL